MSQARYAGVIIDAGALARCVQRAGMRKLSLVLLALLSLGGFYGGLGLVFSPDGSFMQMSPGSLSWSPFRDFTVPGIILSLVNGVLPIVGFVLVWRRHPRAHLLLLLQGVLLSGWISVQMLLLRTFYPPLHVPYWLYGAVLFVVGARMSGDAVTWWLLVSRTVLFAATQVVTFVALRTASVPNAFDVASGWWLAYAAFANVVTIASLYLTRGNLVGLWRFSRETLRSDLLWLGGLLLVAAPIAWLPGRLVARALWGDVDAGNALLIAPLPVAALVVVGLVFVPTQALAELPLYFGHVAPRLARALPAWLATVLAATLLSVQHAALPLLEDGRYLLWRGTMFLPFALLVGFAIRRRPTLLPYLVVVHGLMDLQLPFVVYWASLR